MKKIQTHILFILLLLIPTVTVAQKKEIAEAKSSLKSGTNLDKAEKLMQKVISMPEQNSILDNYVLLADIVRKQYENVNELLYLKQLKDTAGMFNILRKMFIAYESLDSIDAMPNKKGEVKLKYRNRNASYLNKFRPNLYKAGMFFVGHRDFKNAYTYMDAYLDCHSHPLFSNMNYATNDSLANEAAQWAVVSAHREKNYDGVEKYSQWALKYKPKAHHTLVVLYEDYMEQKDTLKAVSFLKKGFNEHPEHHYFFPRLVDYYVSVNHLDTVCDIVNRACEIEPGNMFYRLARNTIQLNIGEYDKCIELGDSLIHYNDKMSDAYLNVGKAYFNKALLCEKEIVAKGKKEIAKKREIVNKYYEKAMPYIEEYRQQRSRQKKQWGPLLYTIYFNLNIGDKFDEIDNLLKRNQE